MNAEFQRIARRDKKAFLKDQCKEMKGNNRMRKMKDEKSKDFFTLQENESTKGTFHVKMGTIKKRNDMDLTEAEDTKKVARIQSDAWIKTWYV